MEAKLSSVMTISAVSRATSVPDQPHSHAHIGLFEGNSIIHPITGHRSDLTQFLVEENDAMFVEGARTGKYAHTGQNLKQFRIGICLHLSTGQISLPSSTIPATTPIASAVFSLSPVIIMTRIPPFWPFQPHLSPRDGGVMDGDHTQEDLRIFNFQFFIFNELSLIFEELELD